jgi:large exoprotein involved in heme utilization and adhesion
MTDLLSVTKGSKLTVSSLEGQAGNIDIQAKDLLLDRGSITAETGKSGVASGANINLNVTNYLTLRMQNESLISATANSFADGGNITINTPFLIAFPSSGANGNDIIAKAFFGDGGKIQIDAIAIFGIEESKALVGNSSNNIDASSEFGSTGVVQINRAIDPNKGLVSLPTGVVNPNDLIAQNPCKRGKKSQLTLTGRSELPPGLTEDFNSTETQINWVEPVATVNEAPSQEIIPKIEAKPRIEPAQGWIFNEKGQVTLVTQANASQRSPLADKGCPVGGIEP